MSFLLFDRCAPFTKAPIIVMAGLVPAIHVLLHSKKSVDARTSAGTTKDRV
jgi:hypothetical protein